MAKGKKPNPKKPDPAKGKGDKANPFVAKGGGGTKAGGKCPTCGKDLTKCKCK